MENRLDRDSGREEVTIMSLSPQAPSLWILYIPAWPYSSLQSENNMHRPEKVQKSLSNGPDEGQVYRRERFAYTCSILGENHKHDWFEMVHRPKHET